jgi:hypothetical protein
MLDSRGWVLPPGAKVGSADPKQYGWGLNDWCWWAERKEFQASLAANGHLPSDDRREGYHQAVSAIGSKVGVGSLVDHRTGKVHWRGALLMTLHNVGVTVAAHKAAIDTHLSNESWLIPGDVRAIATLTDHSFDPSRVAVMKAALMDYPDAYVRRYVASFNVHSHLIKNARLLQGLV